MHIGYARVSTKEQKLDLQMDALKKAGCEKIFSDVISGATKDRPNLDKMLEQLRTEYTVVVYKLDRLGRSLRHLVNLINLFMEKSVHFRSLSDNIDTNTSQGGEGQYSLDQASFSLLFCISRRITSVV